MDDQGLAQSAAKTGGSEGGREKVCDCLYKNSFLYLFFYFNHVILEIGCCKNTEIFVLLLNVGAVRSFIMGVLN
jgi:hypothetical protein